MNGSVSTGRSMQSGSVSGSVDGRGHAHSVMLDGRDMLCRAVKARAVQQFVETMGAHPRVHRKGKDGLLVVTGEQ
jgi:hypothetical protein